MGGSDQQQRVVPPQQVATLALETTQMALSEADTTPCSGKRPGVVDRGVVLLAVPEGEADSVADAASVGDAVLVPDSDAVMLPDLDAAREDDAVEVAVIESVSVLDSELVGDAVALAEALPVPVCVTDSDADALTGLYPVTFAMTKSPPMFTFTTRPKGVTTQPSKPRASDAISEMFRVKASMRRTRPPVSPSPVHTTKMLSALSRHSFHG
jgi:hypothetical protein